MPQLRHRVGDLIDDRYEVQQVLGSGAFGTVYGCQDTELQLLVAVKELHVLDERGGEREAALAEFRAEAIHLSKLRHPNIVSGHYEPQSGEWHVCPVCGLTFPHLHCPQHGARLLVLTSRHYLVMEYIAGPDLLQLTEARGGHLDWLELEPAALEVARALAYIHGRGFVHRDIKPENIRLRADSEAHDANEAVLLDFGIATQGESTTGNDRYGTRVRRQTQGGGTVGYAPPGGNERRAPDARSDVHAFGMTLYHLLTGLDPTEPEHERQMRAEAPRDFVPNLGAALDELILDCIDFEPANRPQDGAQLLARLEALDAQPEPAPRRAQSPSLSTFKLAPQPTPAPTPTPPPIIEPLVFRSGHYVRDLNELAYMLDSQPRESSEKLLSGEVESFLARIGEIEIAQRVAALRVSHNGKTAQTLERVAQAIGLARPLLQINPTTLDFGSLSPDTQKSRELNFSNSGRGLLFGSLRASHPNIKTYGDWEGNRSHVPVSFDAYRLRPGVYRGEIEIRSSAGEFNLPFEAKVNGPSWLPPFLTVVLCSVGGLMTGGALRVLPFTLLSEKIPPLGWLGAQSQLTWLPTAPLFGLVLWISLLAWTTMEAVWKRSCGMWMFFGSLGTLISMIAAMMGVEALISGDVYLRPIVTDWVGAFAPGGWMLAGAAIGSALGVIRRVKDVFSIRILALVLGLGASATLVKLALMGAAQSIPGH